MYVLLINLVSFFLLTPILLTFLLICYIFRRIAECALKLQYKERFAGLLEGTDCIWAIEDPSWLGVIHVLAVLERDPREPIVDAVEVFRNLVRDRLLCSRFEKLLYLRKLKYGYYFWEKCEDIDLSSRIRWLDHDQTVCDGSCNDIYGESWKKVLRDACKCPLPEDHSTSWEILIGRNCPKSIYRHVERMEEGRVHFGAQGRRNSGHSNGIPILFRIHHSIGDGVALLRLLAESFADQEPLVMVDTKDYSMGHRSELNFDSFDKIPTGDKIGVQKSLKDTPVLHTECSAMNNKYVHKTQVDRSKKTEFDPISAYRKMTDTQLQDVLSASMPFTYMMTLRLAKDFVKNYLNLNVKYVIRYWLDEAKIQVENFLYKRYRMLRYLIVDVIYGRIKNVIEVIRVLILAPMCFAQQALCMDNSALHGPPLSGEKLISYWLESDFRSPSDYKLVSKIRNIRSVTGAKFGDILLAAVSSSLHKYFSRIGEAAPKTLTVVLPTRMSPPTKDLSLRNEFSVGLLPLSVRGNDEQLNLDSKLLERLPHVMRADNELRNGPDFLINFWVMKFVSAALPVGLLKAVLESYSTLIFSNLPGPEEVRIQGHTMKDVIFWIPHRSTTGIGCSVLSYGGNLHLSLVADKALVREEKFLQEILEDTVREIDDLHDSLTMSVLMKKLQWTATAPKEEGIGVL